METLNTNTPEMPEAQKDLYDLAQVLLSNNEAYETRDATGDFYAEQDYHVEGLLEGGVPVDTIRATYSQFEDADGVIKTAYGIGMRMANINIVRAAVHAESPAFAILMGPDEEELGDLDTMEYEHSGFLEQFVANAKSLHKSGRLSPVS